MLISPLARITKPESVLVRELSGELVLLNLDTECYYGLDDIGTRIWSVVIEAENLDTALAMLHAEFEVDPEALRADVAHFLGELAAAGLIACADAGPAPAA